MAALADFDLDAGFAAFRFEAGRFAALVFAASFAGSVRGFALAARFVLARDDALLFLLFAIDPCFPSRPARDPGVARGF